MAKLDTWVHRVTGVPLDARAAVGVYDPATNKYTLHAGSGGVVRQKARACHDPRRAEPPFVRVECGDVGGNFGTRNAFYPGVRAGGVGGEAPRPPGEMDLRALGGVRSATTRAATR